MPCKKYLKQLRLVLLALLDKFVLPKAVTRILKLF